MSLISSLCGACNYLRRPIGVCSKLVNRSLSSPEPKAETSRIAGSEYENINQFSCRKLMAVLSDFQEKAKSIRRTNLLSVLLCTKTYE